MVTPDNQPGHRWGQTKFVPWWQHQHRGLNYIHEPFNDNQSVQKWLALGFENQRFTGDLYDMRQSEPGCIAKFRQSVTLQNLSWSFYRMKPGTVLPEHSDTYAKFCELYRIDDIDRVRRYVVFLEDWQSGHYFEIDQVPIMNWSAGDTVWWEGSCPHIAANIGCTDRYTLQLTGIKTHDIS